MKSKTKSSRGRSILAHTVLILLSFMCLFFFYVLIINATRSHAELQKGFSALPGKYFFTNLKNVANDGSFPMFRGILNSLIVSGCSAALCTYFSALTAYGLYAYDFKGKKVAFTFIMAILVMPTQVTAMGFLRLVTNMGMYDSLLPLIIPSIVQGLHVKSGDLTELSCLTGIQQYRRMEVFRGFVWQQEMILLCREIRMMIKTFVMRIKKENLQKKKSVFVQTES